MSGTRDQLRRVEALIQVGMRLARTARSGRVLLARIADGIDLEWIPRPWGDAIVAELEAAQADAREPLGGREVERRTESETCRWLRAAQRR